MISGKLVVKSIVKKFILEGTLLANDFFGYFRLVLHHSTKKSSLFLKLLVKVKNYRSTLCGVRCQGQIGLNIGKLRWRQLWVALNMKNLSNKMKNWFRKNFFTIQIRSSCGRVVKAIDSKSIGLCPRRFESCQLRNVFLHN